MKSCIMTLKLSGNLTVSTASLVFYGYIGSKRPLS